MSPIAYLFVAAGVLLMRQVIVGRVDDIPQDTKDFLSSFFAGDMAGVRDVASRRGENMPENPGAFGDSFADVGESLSNSTFVAACMTLGNAAKGYRLGATGPDYYDCSGLIWQAMRKIGVYKGARFTTATFKTAVSGTCARVSDPARGDVVLWPYEGGYGHMGVALGDDRMYSARSTAKGIGESSISGDSGYFGREPEYWRITPEAWSKVGKS